MAGHEACHQNCWVVQYKIQWKNGMTSSTITSHKDTRMQMKLELQKIKSQKKYNKLDIVWQGKRWEQERSRFGWQRFNIILVLHVLDNTVISTLKVFFLELHYDSIHFRTHMKNVYMLEPFISWTNNLIYFHIQKKQDEM